MRNQKGEKAISMTIRMDAQTEKKYYAIWDILQALEPYPIRLKRQDIFSRMVQEYYQTLAREYNYPREHNPMREHR